MSWWHIAHTPGGVHAHELDIAQGDPMDVADALGNEAQRIRDELLFPTDWFSVPDWDSQVSEGEPHAKLLAIATVHRLST